MARKRVRPLGQITFRLMKADHGELVEVARVLDLDMSGLMHRILAEARPAYLRWSVDALRKQLETESIRDESLMLIALPPEAEPLVRVAMEAGWGVGSGHLKARMDAMWGAIEPALPPDATALLPMQVLVSAQRRLEAEARRAAMADSMTRLSAELEAVTNPEVEDSPEEEQL